MAAAILIIGLAIVVAYGLLRFFPDGTKRWVRRIMRFRNVVGAIASVALALFFIASGVTLLQLVGFLMFTYAFLILLFEKPHKEVRKWIPI